MLFKVVKPFGPSFGDAWTSYIAWTHQKTMQRFDSVDGILREDCFEPEAREDWENCVNEHFKLNLITNLEFARKVQEKNLGSEIIGVDIEIEDGYSKKDGLLGYDIIDEHCHVSLITNWGNDANNFGEAKFKGNGLIGELGEALTLRDRLRTAHVEDSHASGCHVWAVYEISP